MRNVLVLLAVSATIIGLPSRSTHAQQIAWQRTFGGTEEDRAYSVHQTDDGGYILAGYTESYGAGGADVWLVKTDAQGALLWDRTFGGAGADWAYSVQQTGDSGYIVAAHTRSYGAGKSDAWLIKIAPEGPSEPPAAYRLGQNQPNPSNQATTIHYELPQPGYVTLAIYTLAGQQVANVISARHQPGAHQVVWNASGFASGVYYYRLHAGGFTQAKRMVLLK